MKHGKEVFIVHLQDNTCTCTAWQLNGIPCAHVLVVIRVERLKCKQFVHPYYSTEMLRRTYSHTLQPINGRDIWESTPGKEVGAAPFPPKKKSNYQFRRKPEENEKACSFGKVYGDGSKINCLNCGQVRHNKKTCSKRIKNLKVLAYTFGG